jgi:mRNA deadenylase 3'-5' endonuclease subunit Ccr4
MEKKHNRFNFVFLPKENTPKTNINNIRVTNYNILSQSLLPHSISPHIKSSSNKTCLKWPYRKQLLLSQLNELNSDIIFLEEYEHSSLFNEQLCTSKYDVFNYNILILL